MELDFDEEPAAETRNGPKKRFRKNKLKLVFDREERQKFLSGFRKRKQERKEKYIEKLERDLAKEKKRIRQQTQRKAKLSSSHSIIPEVQNLIDTMPEKEETYDLGGTMVHIKSLDDQIYRNLPTIKEEDEGDLSEEELPSSTQINKMRKWGNESGLNLIGGESEIEDEDDDTNRTFKSDPFFNPINDDEISRSDLSSEEEEQVNYDPLAMLRKNTGSSEPDPNPLTKAKLEKQANRLLQQTDAFKKMIRIKQKRSKKFRLFKLKSSEENGEGQASTQSKGKGGKLFKNLRNGKKRK